MADIRGLTGRKPAPEYPEEPGVWTKALAGLVSDLAGKAIDIYGETEYIIPAKEEVERRSAFEEYSRNMSQKFGVNVGTFEDYERSQASGEPQPDLLKTEPVGGIDFGSGEIAHEARARSLVEKAKMEGQRRATAATEGDTAYKDYMVALTSLKDDFSGQTKALQAGRSTTSTTNETRTQTWQGVAAYIANLASGAETIEKLELTPGQRQYMERHNLAGLWSAVQQGQNVHKANRLLKDIQTIQSSTKATQVTKEQLAKLREIDFLMNRARLNQGMVTLALKASQVEERWIAAGYVKLDAGGIPVPGEDGLPQLDDQHRDMLDRAMGLAAVGAVHSRISNYGPLHGIAEMKPEHWSTAFQGFSPMVLKEVVDFYDFNPQSPYFKSSGMQRLLKYAREKLGIQAPTTPTPGADSESRRMGEDPLGSIRRLVQGIESEQGSQWKVADFRGQAGMTFKADPYSDARLAQVPGRVSDAGIIRNMVSQWGTSLGSVPTFSYGALLGKYGIKLSDSALTDLQKPRSQWSEETKTAMEGTGVVQFERDMGSVSDYIFEQSSGGAGADTERAVSAHILKFRPRQTEIMKNRISSMDASVKRLSAALGVKEITLHEGLTRAMTREQQEIVSPGGKPLNRAANIVQSLLTDYGPTIRARFVALSDTQKEQIYQNINTIMLGTQTSRQLSELALEKRPEVLGEWVEPDQPFFEEGGTREERFKPLVKDRLYKEGVKITVVQLHWYAQLPEGSDNIAKEWATKLLMALSGDESGGINRQQAVELIAGITRYNTLRNLDNIHLNSEHGGLNIGMTRFRKNSRQSFRESMKELLTNPLVGFPGRANPSPWVNPTP